MFDAIVIGGGIGGLSAAWELRDRQILLLERSERLGGRIKTESRGDYWLNFGGHLFPPPDSHTGKLVTELGLETRRLPGRLAGMSINNSVVSTGRIETYPFRLKLSLPGQLSLIKAGLKLKRALTGYIDAATPRAGDTPAQTRLRGLAYMGDISFAEFLGEVTPEVRALFAAEVARVTASLEETAAGSGVAHFAVAMSGLESYARNLPGGSGLLIEALARELDAVIRTESKVEEVVAGDESVTVKVQTRDGHQVLQSRYAVVATPAYISAEIIKTLPRDTTDALRAIPYGRFIVAGILTNESGAKPWDDLYTMLVADKSFNVFSNQANVLRGPGQPRRSGGSLMLYSGGPKAAPLWDLDDEQITERYLKDIEAIFPGIGTIVEEVKLQRWENAIPYLPPGRHKLQGELEKPLGRLFLAGDYFDHPAMDGSVVPAVEGAREIRRQLESNHAFFSPSPSGASREF